MNGSVQTNGGPRSAAAHPPATAAPASPFTVQAPVSGAAAHRDGSPLHGPEVPAFSSSSASPRRTGETAYAPSSTSAPGVSTVIHVPLAFSSEATAGAAHDGPIAATATQSPSASAPLVGGLSKHSSSFLATPSLTIAAWRGADHHSSESNGGSGFGHDRHASKVFDPTEVPALRHTMKVTVTRDGKAVEEALDPYEVARLYGQQQAALRSLQSRYDFLAVPDWVRVHPLLGTYLAELVGSFAWVLTLALVSVRNTSIFTVADDTNMTPIPIGFMFTTMIFTFGYVSNAHLNPAVSVAVFLIRQMELSQCFVYILCQLGGAFLAGVVAMVIQGNSGIFVPSVSGSYITSGIFSELIFTFAICLVVLNIAYSRQSGNFFYGFAVGMTITAGSASVGRISGGAFNPAAATGLQVAICIVSNCDELKSVWIYWVAPLIGAVAASLLFSQMVQPTDTQVLEDNKVFQDVKLLHKQRQTTQQQTAATAAAMGRGDDADDTHSDTSTSSSGQPATPTSSTNSSDSNSYHEMHVVSHTRSPRSRPALTREEAAEAAAEEHEEHNVTVPTHTPAPPTNATAAASAVDPWKAPVVTNNSDLDNWRRRPPPRRDDHDGEAMQAGSGSTNWF
ncbi:aquaporin-like protein [Leptomonas pyrrhocoris]|uniref:Aquaporin-like protein n=1 Tax=Leptomonas pyrrhocoris TaxID=157538 RepID=A0A0M9G8H8_LEPPY|nr:aquaporin-like protein [Leptomonas pyrrhocoris]KPA84827.1 aquaporin-like protein [Leptomonas pyrrhocoris]|eukprot:XP_015663266.1 aquaporin-like protein [Leptomonas pyrrhocoris]